MTPLRQHMMTALELSGKSQRTQPSYGREVRLLATFYNNPPHLLSEAELRRYLLHQKNKDRLAPSSMRICYSGIRFFYRYGIERDWKLLDLIRAQAEQRRTSRGR
jgi:site-specific recombinase XerD